MNYLETIQVAIKQSFNCESVHIRTVPLKDVYAGKVVWDGEVEVFELKGHPKAKYAYGWGFEEEKDAEFATVLGIPPINTPEDAVKAYVVSKIKKN